MGSQTAWCQFCVVKYGKIISINNKYSNNLLNWFYSKVNNISVRIGF